QINCIAGALSGQDTLVINGLLTDKDTKEPVLFANVFLEKLEQTTLTDFDGKFKFTLIGDFSSLQTETIRGKYTGYPTIDSLIFLENYIDIPLRDQQNLKIMFESGSVDFDPVRQ